MDGVTLREASENLPGLIERVERGEDVVITRDGVPAVRLVRELPPAKPGKRVLTAAQEKALAESRVFLLEGWPLGVGRFDREALYDDVVGVAEAAVTRFTLDSNVLVHAADGRDSRQRAAVEIIERAVSLDCVLVPQVLGEFVHAVTRKGFVPPALAASQMGRWRLMFPEVVAGYGITELETGIAERSAGRFQFWDAVLPATAGAAGCTALVSEDMAHGARLGRVTVIRAFEGSGISPEAAALLA